MNGRRLRLLCAAAVLGAGSLLVAAQVQSQYQWQDLQEVRHAAESFAQAQVGTRPGRTQVEAAALDPRLRLARCESLQPYLAPGRRLWGGRSVGVRCVRPHAWSVSVPLAVRVFAEVMVK